MVQIFSYEDGTFIYLLYFIFNNTIDFLLHLAICFVSNWLLYDN